MPSAEIRNEHSVGAELSFGTHQLESCEPSLEEAASLVQKHQKEINSEFGVGW